MTASFSVGPARCGPVPPTRTRTGAKIRRPGRAATDGGRRPGFSERRALAASSVQPGLSALKPAACPRATSGEQLVV